MKESDIVKAIMKYLKTVPGCFCWKEHGGTALVVRSVDEVRTAINGSLR